MKIPQALLLILAGALLLFVASGIAFSIVSLFIEVFTGYNLLQMSRDFFQGL